MTIDGNRTHIFLIKQSSAGLYYSIFKQPLGGQTQKVIDSRHACLFINRRYYVCYTKSQTVYTSPVMTQFPVKCIVEIHQACRSRSLSFDVYCEEPPEIVMTWPLTQPPSSLAKKATTRATSSASAQRPNGQCEDMSDSILSAGNSGVAPGM